MSELRKFGFIFSGYYLAVVLLFVFHHHAIVPIVWAALLATVFCALVAPNWLTPVKWMWDGVLKILNYVNTRLLFGFLFFVIFTPIAFFKKESLGLCYDNNATTYRTDCRDMKIDLQRPY